MCALIYHVVTYYITPHKSCQCTQDCTASVRACSHTGKDANYMMLHVWSMHVRVHVHVCTTEAGQLGGCGVPWACSFNQIKGRLN